MKIPLFFGSRSSQRCLFGIQIISKLKKLVDVETRNYDYCLFTKDNLFCAIHQMSGVFFVVKRGVLPVTSGVGAFGVYKALYDPPHLIWDLDETILRSIPMESLRPKHGRAKCQSKCQRPHTQQSR